MTVKPENDQGDICSEDIEISDLPFEMHPEEEQPSSSRQVIVEQYVELPKQAPKRKATVMNVEQIQPPTITINDALIDLILTDELPLNVMELEGFRRYSSILSPSIDLPSQMSLRRMLDQRYRESCDAIKCALVDCMAYSLSIGEWMDQGRSLIGVTCHYVDHSEWALKSATIGFEELPEDVTEDDVTIKVETILGEWGVNKDYVVSVTVVGTSPVINSAFGELFGQEKLLFCFAHTLNVIARKPFDDLVEIHELIDEIKVLTDFIRQGDELLVDEDDSVEGQQFWELIYGTNGSWKGLYNQLSHFVKYSKKIESLLDQIGDTPPMPTDEVMSQIKEVVFVLRPLNGVCDDLCVEPYMKSAKVIPLIQCLLASQADTWPETPAGMATKDIIIEQITENYGGIEENEVYALGTLLDPRFKKNYFKSVTARDAAIEKLKEMVASGDPFEDKGEGELEEVDGIWRFHRTFVADQQTTVVNPVAMYLSTKVSDLRNTDPLKFFQQKHVDFRPAAERLFVSQATCLPAKKIFSESGAVLGSNWASLPVTDLRKLMFLSSISNLGN